MTKPSTVDEYCAGFSGPARELLEQLRRLSRESAPGTAETLKWGHPAVVHSRGTILWVYSAHKNHANIVFTPSTREAFDDELTDFTTGKGSVKLPYGSPVPEQLLARMIAYRIEEFENDGVKWM